MAALIFPALLAGAGCSERDALSPSSASHSERIERIKTARANLKTFYLGNFGPVIESGFYDDADPILRLGHYAHRLWVPDRDWTYGEALKTLAGRVQSKQVSVRQGDGSRPLGIAYFADGDQFHRDQYAMIMSEMGIGDLGGKPLSRFTAAAAAGYGSELFSRRGDRAWTAALLAATTRPGEGLSTAAGEPLTVDRVIEDMLSLPFLPESADPFSCYDYHSVYGLMVAVDNGYDSFREVAVERMREAFKVAERVCADSRSRGDAMEEIIGRLKLNGHLAEAFYRAGVGVIPRGEFEAEIDRVLEGLHRDSVVLRGVVSYSGPPDMFVSVPHAIHGLDLALSRLVQTD